MIENISGAINRHIYGFTFQELNFPLEPSEYQKATKNFVSFIAGDRCNIIFVNPESARSLVFYD
ncbi:hypothetical protein H6G81_28965 [Scytonema hofmannii FACHB-248]|uniref:Uncharacterized protein n=1 Tax=Scytonema hofmannii FACHB-248 TaxID=1842502 RepID=A0ABR8GZB0_9CYAN|nr:MULTISPECIES: hypothetical protein [Nostocales]MBD2608442.1 hypothetical protein [Scytonema hofmannii FACHB-248]